MPAPVEAPETPPGLQHKAAVTTEPIVTTDDRTGEVTAVVSVTNVVDEVGDVIMPGAYTATLAKRKPKGVWSHSWKDWVARTEEIREYAPGDPQLKALLDEAGAKLPADAGALVVRCKFNMDDPDSYKAYQKVKFFSETGECQWSIGYSVPPSMGTRDAKGIRHIKGLELFEYSPVLFGAASQSTSLSVKSLDPAAWPEEVEQKDGQHVVDIVWDDGLTYNPSAAAPSDEELDAVEAAAVEAAEADDSDVPDAPDPDEEPAGDEPAAPVEGDDSGDTPPPVEATDAADDADTPGEVTEVKRQFTAKDRDKAASSGAAMPDGSFPIHNEQDLRNAIQAVGRAKDQDAAKRHIIKRARALKLTNLLPDGWVSEQKSDDPAEVLADLQARLAEVEAKYDTSPVGKPGGKQNWVDKAGGLPPFIRAVAHALIRAGHSQQQAIQLAVGVIRRWASGGGDVTAATRAKAAATIARWEAMKASKDDETAVETPAVEEAPENQAEPVAAEAASGEPDGLLTKWDPAAEIGLYAAHRPTPAAGTGFAVESKDLPQLAGTFEERREMVRIALSDLLIPDSGEDTKDVVSGNRPWLCVDGTWDDQVVATVYTGDQKSTWRVPYTIEANPPGSSMVVFGDPQAARLTLSVDAAAGDDYDVPAAFTDGMDAAMLGAKMLTASPQVKAGRVLSGMNATKIATAVESLIAVLQSAGVQINVPDSEPATADTGETEQKSVPVSTDEDFDVAELYAEAARLRVLALRS